MTPEDPFDLALTLLDRVAMRLERGDHGAPASRAVIQGVLGVWDDCCGEDGGGQLTVRVQRVFQAVAFPVEQAQPRGGCFESTTVAHYVVELVACAPTQGDGGEPPSGEAITEAAQITLARATAMYLELLAWWAEMHGQMNDAQVRALEPLPETGGCVGYQVQVLADLGSPCPFPA